jgi:hypothetical protein
MQKKILPDTANFVQLFFVILYGMMKKPQAGQVSAVWRKSDRGKSALHRAGCRVTPGTNKAGSYQP